MKAGLEYSIPKVTLLQQTGIGVSEIAGRTCYDSFDKSENREIVEFGVSLKDGSLCEIEKFNAAHIEHSDLLDSLAWVHHHLSILEHSSLSYMIRGTSRAVLQEHARHRIQSISVRSTRYTMQSVINAFLAARIAICSKRWFIAKMKSFDMLVIKDKRYQEIEYECTYDKLMLQLDRIGLQKFCEISLSRDNLEYYRHCGLGDSANSVFTHLENGKSKKNVGDNFKHIVTDNWKVDMVVTFNLRSLKNFFELRENGAAYFQIRNLAQEMIKVTPDNYLELIMKQNKIDRIKRRAK